MSANFPTSRLQYVLPPELIAQTPPEQRGWSRMLHVRVAEGELHDRAFTDLPDLLPQGCAPILNDSRVIPARVFGQRVSGARVELLYLRYESDGVIEAVVGSNAKLGAGEVIELPGGWTGELLSEKSREGSRVLLKNATGTSPAFADLMGWLNEHGEVPLPPYIKRERMGAQATSPASSEQDENAGEGARAPRQRDPTAVGGDKDRYQTVYAAAPGSAAAPTAGLHFTDEMLAELRRRGHPVRTVTLHVGLGTFAGVHVEDLAQHEMHSEAYSVPKGLADELEQWRSEGRPVCAVGTTSLRVLHTVGCRPACTGSEPEQYQSQEVQAGLHPTETRAFIYPGQGTHAADLLLTNFHLPGSTLLALVYAFGGEELMRRAYQHAIAQRYRFFSYGDCMLIDRCGAKLNPDGTVVEDA